jgi:hypothetical protein
MASLGLKLDPNTPERPIITHDVISNRAYALWMEKGCPDGCEYENWFQAENELKTKQGIPLP